MSDISFNETSLNSEALIQNSALLDIDLEQVMGYLMMRVAQNMERGLEQVLAPLDITKTQFILLSISQFLGKRHEFVTQSLIAQYSGLDLMMISQVARRMEEKGLIERVPHPSDSRAKLLQLTPRGKELLLSARQQVSAAGEDYFSILTDNQQKQLKKQLQKLYFHYRQES